jgi:membrane associated rhomboid family serine protease
MILPIGHEDSKVNRIPWATISIIALCILIHLVTFKKVDRAVEKANQTFQQLFVYYLTHPYLEMDPVIGKLLTGNESKDEEGNEISEMFSQLGKAFGKTRENEPDEYVKEEEQQKLDEMVQTLKAVLDEIPYKKWGFVPTKKSFATLLSYMFVHGGWWHLFGNLLLLYVMGPVIEDAYGKIVFTAFYLFAGAVSALLYAAHYPDFSGPLIGASGAISGVMGAFLIRYWKSRIKFLFVFYFGFVFLKRFTAPAWLILPLWLIREFLFANALDSLKVYGGGGVAHWAHVWGFVCGIGVAVGLRYFKFEEKFIKPKVQEQTSYSNENAIAFEDAMALIDTGDKDKAYAMLMDAARKDSTYQDTVEALWNLGIELGREKESAPYFIKLIEKELRHQEIDKALFHYGQFRSKLPDTPISLQTRILLMEELMTREEFKEAEILGGEIFKSITIASPPGILLNFCSAALKLDMHLNLSLGEQVVALCLQHPEIPQYKKEELKENFKDLPAPSIPSPPQVTAASTSSAQMPLPTLSENIEAPTGIAPPSRTAEPQISPDSMPPLEELELELSNPIPEPVHSQPDGAELTTTVAAGTTSAGAAVINALNGHGDPQQLPDSPDVTNIYKPPIIPSPQSSPPSQPPQPLEPSEAPAQNLDNTENIFSDFSLPRTIILKTTDAVPMQIKDGKMKIMADNVGERVLSLERIKHISVVKITPPEERAFLLIDLILTDLSHVESEIRIIRLSSKTFNPKSFIPSAQNPLDALKRFSAGMLKLTGALPYPDLESVQLKKYFTFKTILEYEDAIQDQFTQELGM